ncbi:amidase [uncultured Ferrovibrio sp.]|jgi:amidase|uniref:amidase n=1 Tax=uncultured Ferrovibrio sp. TaxID=1576913 RepID=UPI002609CF09|nr:amidase [uncultured Ferrovibrio sp.]
MAITRRDFGTLAAAAAGSASMLWTPARANLLRDSRATGRSSNMEYRTATAWLQDLRARKISALELTDQAIARIEALDGKLNAMAVRDFERARVAASQADAALARGEMRPLLGLPMTVKESFNIAGLPTTWGIPGTQNIKVQQDAVAVSRLKAAGAVILGKTNVAMLLADWQSTNPVYGTTNNPWDVARTPGGSSGGSAAALAAGYVPLELGSDLAGSLRVPAHFCGVYAHKPTLDLIPDRGQSPPGAPVFSVSSRFDLPVIGPMARSAEDLMLALDVLAGPDDDMATAYKLQLPAPRHAALKDFRVLVIDSHPQLPIDAAVRDAIAALASKLEQTGCKIGHTSPLLPDLSLIGSIYLRKLMAFVGSTMPQPEYDQAKARAAAILPSASDLQSLSALSLVSSYRDWMQADFVRVGLAHQWRNFFREWDILLCPVMPTPAFKHDHSPMERRVVSVDGKPVAYADQFLWPGIATLCGLPATAFPAGLSKEGLPVGVQVIGPYLEDRTPIAFAALVEQAFGGFVAPPPL